MTPWPLLVVLLLALAWQSWAHRRSSKASSAYQRRYRALLDSSPNAIVIYNAEVDHIIEANRAACQLFDCSPGALPAVALTALHSLVTSRAALTQSTLDEPEQHADDGVNLVFEQAIVALSGQLIPCEIRVVKLPSGEGKLLCATFANLSARKQTEAALLRQAEQLEASVQARTAELAVAFSQAEEANRDKSRFLAKMGHTLRTPLNAITGYAQLLRQSRDLPEHLGRYVETIGRCAEQMIDVIERISLESKAGGAGVTGSLERFTFAALFKDIAATLEPRASEKGLTLALAIDPEVPTPLFGEPDKIRQIVLHVLDNAIKFTGHGRVSAQVSVLHKGPAGLTLCIEMRDTGPGMAAEELAGVFLPFNQQAGGRQPRGTGFGMAISRAHARMMGGDLTIESGVGAGTTVRLQCHASTDDVHVAGGAASAPGQSGSPYGEDGSAGSDLRAPLAPDVVATLIDLIECGYSTRFEQSIALHLGEHYPALHRRLKQLSDRFDYAAILSILRAHAVGTGERPR